MPKIVLTSMWITIATLVLTPLSLLIPDRPPMPSLPLGTIEVLMPVILNFLVPLYGVMLLFVYLTYRGKNWARWVNATVYLWGAVPYVRGLLPILKTSSIYATTCIVIVIAEVVAIAMLFTPRANAWYREVKGSVAVA